MCEFQEIENTTFAISSANKYAKIHCKKKIVKRIVKITRIHTVLLPAAVLLMSSLKQQHLSVFWVGLLFFASVCVCDVNSVNSALWLLLLLFVTSVVYFLFHILQSNQNT